MTTPGVFDFLSTMATHSIHAQLDRQDFSGLAVSEGTEFPRMYYALSDFAKAKPPSQSWFWAMSIMGRVRWLFRSVTLLWLPRSAPMRQKHSLLNGFEQVDKLQGESELNAQPTEPSSLDRPF